MVSRLLIEEAVLLMTTTFSSNDNYMKFEYVLERRKNTHSFVLECARH